MAPGLVEALGEACLGAIPQKRRSGERRSIKKSKIIKESREAGSARDAGKSG